MITHTEPDQLRRYLNQLASEFGFQTLGVTLAKIDIKHQHYHDWIGQHYHGEMSYMARNIDKRLEPAHMVPGTLSVISVQMNYLTQPSEQCIDLLDHPRKAYISRYALGRDYHKLLRKRLQKMADALSDRIGPFGYRVFTDSAPVLEKALATQAGLGWQGKHSNVLNREHGSWFFLGEIYTDLVLTPDQPTDNHCGDCTSCIDVCPTAAIVKPYVVDSRRCISYLTIEHHSAIPLEFRSAIGNRIYGCDDCQLYCPWNRFAKITTEADFRPRHGLDDIELSACMSWDESTFLDRFEGSAIRRIGFQKWQRNIAVALGNAAPDPYIIDVLKQALPAASALVAEHIHWAIEQQSQQLQHQNENAHASVE